MRWLSALGLCAALALAFTFSGTSEANAKRSAKNKQCMATNAATKKKVSWRCSGSERCCYDSVMNKGSCVPANGMCL